MSDQAEFLRVNYTSRVDVAADNIEAFVATVLSTIDKIAARNSPRQWAIVCRFFAGCARAARAQGQTPQGGGRQIAKYLKDNFPSEEEGSSDGFYELMDWLSNPKAFRPTRLRRAIEQA